MKKVFVILAALSLGACTNFSEAFGGWVGNHTDELVTQWGPPVATHQMRDGRKVLSYNAQEHFSVEGPGIPVPFSGTYWCEVTYVTDSDGFIVSWNGKGNIGGCNALLRRKGLPPERTN